MDCAIVDVFAERPLAGNQLAVIRRCGHLESAEMQAIAREMNFSETSFVVAERAGEASVRIFTVDRELPFAGHPTLGTAWVLGRGLGSYTLDLPAGRVPVAFDPGGIAWMEPPPVALGDGVEPGLAAAALGLEEADLDHRFPCRFATIGPWFLLVGVRTLDALRRVAVDPAVYREISAGGWLSLFVFAEEPYSEDADFAARMLTFHGDAARGPGDGERQRGLRGPSSRAGQARPGGRRAGLRDRAPVAALSRHRRSDPRRRQGAAGADRKAGILERYPAGTRRGRVDRAARISARPGSPPSLAVVSPHFPPHRVQRGIAMAISSTKGETLG